MYEELDTFERALQHFGTRVEIVAAMEMGGRISAEDAYQMIKAEIKELLIDKLNFEQRRLNQIQAINSGDYNFFFLNIFGEEATIKYKLSHSITTSWGMSLYEQSCKIIARKVGYECETQKKNLGQINSEAMLYISSLQNDNNRVPNKDEEIENPYSEEENRYFFHNAFSFFKREVLLKFKFNENLVGKEDRYWANDRISKGEKILYTNTAIVEHHFTENGNTWKNF